MTLYEQEQLLDRLSGLAEYYEKPKSPATLALYVQELNNLPFQAVSAALKHHVNRGFPLFPKISEIRVIVEGDETAAADTAWAELHREFRRVGSWSTPTLSPLTLETVSALCGDWTRACALIGRAEAGPELQGWQKRFQETYRVQAMRAQMALPGRPQSQIGLSPARAVDGGMQLVKGNTSGTNVPGTDADPVSDGKRPGVT